jgi:hypothetical protein
VAPFVESLPSSIPTFEEKNIFETRYIRVCVSGRYVYFFFRGPQGFIQSEYVTWIVSTIEGWSEYEFFEGFSSGFEKVRHEKRPHHLLYPLSLMTLVYFYFASL